MEKVSHEANAAINNFYQAFGGDFENLSLRDCHFLEEELACALNSVSNIITKHTVNNSKPKKGIQSLRREMKFSNSSSLVRQEEAVQSLNRDQLEIKASLALK